MKKISIILLFLTAVCPLAQAQRVKVYVTDAWDKPLGEVAVTLGRGRTPVAVTGADGMAEVDAGEGDRTGKGYGPSSLASEACAHGPCSQSVWAWQGRLPVGGNG